jgi:hypothetical protein
MRRKILNIAILLAALLIASCKEVFFPDDIISDERIPVIQANIFENKIPEVKISWAINYEDRKSGVISGASVWMTDNEGNSVDFNDAGKGVYTPENIEFKGVSGREYVLHAEINGLLYESYPEKIYPAPVIDSLYAVPLKKTLESLNAQGYIIKTSAKGLDIKADLSGNSDSTCFFRYHTDICQEIAYTLNPNSMQPIQVYEWNSWILDKTYSVSHTFKSAAGQVVPEHNTGFLEFKYDPYQASESQTAPYPIGWIVSMHVFSISPGIYQYYKSIEQQLNADNSIFAAVPSQVKGNIRCITDEYSKVIGIFEAGAETVLYKGFSFIDEKRYRSIPLVSFPDNPGAGSLRNSAPAFWISF